MLGMGVSPRLSHAEQLRARMGPQELHGSRFDLAYSSTPVNFTGKDLFATAINGSVPAPVLRWKEGETVTLSVTNNMAEDTSIHWHGIILPSAQDGVPNISDGFKGIKPGETYSYRFPVMQSGHLLVPQPFGLSGADRGLRCHRHRLAGAGAFLAMTATMW